MRDLEQALVELGAHVAYPPEPDLARAVRTRLVAPDGAGRSASWRRHPRWRAAVVALAALVAVSSAVLTALPDLRSAVADWLGIDGVRITTGGPTPTPAGGSLDLGAPVTLDEARARVPFEVAVPGALGEPDQVFVDELVPGGQVALLYLAREGLPATPGTETGALVTQFQGSLEDPVVKKVIAGEPGTEIRPVRVGGSPGYWISGEPHFISYVGPNGEPREDTVRLVGNVLLWARDGVTSRIESALSMREALAIAESMR